jgi:hypothetical protein
MHSLRPSFAKPQRHEKIRSQRVIPKSGVRLPSGTAPSTNGMAALIAFGAAKSKALEFLLLNQNTLAHGFRF